MKFILDWWLVLNPAFSFLLFLQLKDEMLMEADEDSKPKSALEKLQVCILLMHFGSYLYFHGFHLHHQLKKGHS